MSLFDLSSLTEFTGTSQLYKISDRFVLTDGTKFLADQAHCYWLMDAVASHLLEIGASDWFVVIKTTVANSSAVMVYEDGNGHEHARQTIPYTDLPLAEVNLYACWDGEQWVIMLPSEY